MFLRLVLRGARIDGNSKKVGVENLVSTPREHHAAYEQITGFKLALHTGRALCWEAFARRFMVAELRLGK